MENIFNFHFEDPPLPVYKIEADLNLVRHFLEDLPKGMEYFIKSENSNLIDKLQEVTKDQMLSSLYQKSYFESFYGYENILADFPQPYTSEPPLPSAIDARSKDLHSRLKKIGMTGHSLRLKWKNFKGWWNKLSDIVKDLPSKIVDFGNKKIRPIFKGLMGCLNAILGSMKEIFPLLEAIKEWKEMLESANDRIDAELEPTQ